VPVPLASIADTKEDAISDDKSVTTTVTMYTDRSSINGGASASAVLYTNGRRRDTVQYNLEPESEHTVYEAEVVGIILCIALIGA
jgi:hypothetical protein